MQRFTGFILGVGFTEKRVAAPNTRRGSAIRFDRVSSEILVPGSSGSLRRHGRSLCFRRALASQGLKKAAKRWQPVILT